MSKPTLIPSRVKVTQEVSDLLSRHLNMRVINAHTDYESGRLDIIALSDTTLVYVIVRCYQHGEATPWPSASDIAQELVPDVLATPTHSDFFQSYEPFIATDGWREISTSAGPFVVEHEEIPPAHFDFYDLSTIALYEQE